MASFANSFNVMFEVIVWALSYTLVLVDEGVPISSVVTAFAVRSTSSIASFAAVNTADVRRSSVQVPTIITGSTLSIRGSNTCFASRMARLTLPNRTVAPLTFWATNKTLCWRLIVF